RRGCSTTRPTRRERSVATLPGRNGTNKAQANGKHHANGKAKTNGRFVAPDEPETTVALDTRTGSERSRTEGRARRTAAERARANGAFFRIMLDSGAWLQVRPYGMGLEDRSKLLEQSYEAASRCLQLDGLLGYGDEEDRVKAVAVVAGITAHHPGTTELQVGDVPQKDLLAATLALLGEGRADRDRAERVQYLAADAIAYTVPKASPAGVAAIDARVTALKAAGADGVNRTNFAKVVTAARNRRRTRDRSSFGERPRVVKELLRDAPVSPELVVPPGFVLLMNGVKQAVEGVPDPDEFV